ncbi:histone H1-beta, late embryonic [Xyrauchen texanus]|uniref:histone H1-beta, late embryonic n=1 Tax=Xyrauchen texanus TaxID=154827 RepID=UPI002242111E|nr:histone H1-beta, late embryonic [Xyrauchen texanus]
MAPKKAAVEPTATISKDSEPETLEETKTDVSEGTSSKAAVRKVSPHPSTMEMVKEALKELDSRKGVSAQAIRGYIKERYTTVDETRLKFMVRRTLTKGIETGVFVRPANSGPTMTGAQGRFRIASKTKAKEAKAQSKENADPNLQKAPKPKKAKASKVMAEGASEEKPKSTKKKATNDDVKPKASVRNGTASKVAPAKKPKAKIAAGEGAPEPKPSRAKASKKEGAEEPAAKKAGRKAKTAATPEESETGEKGAAVAKAPGKRGRK